MPVIRRTACSAELDPRILTAAERLQFEGFQRCQKTNMLIQRMGAEGVPIKRIVRVTALSRAWFGASCAVNGKTFPGCAKAA